jgi:hypothetical protein
MTNSTDIPVLVTTQHRGVFAGLVPADHDMSLRSFPLRAAKMAIYWGTTRGVMELAESGPTKDSRIGAPADIAMLHDVTAVFAITAEAWAAWEKA